MVVKKQRMGDAFKPFTSSRSSSENAFASQSERGGCRESEDGLLVMGYQAYRLDPESGLNPKRLLPKYTGLGVLCEKLVMEEGHTSLLDVGACLGLASQIGLKVEFKDVAAVEHDKEYLHVLHEVNEWSAEHGLGQVTIHDCHVTPETKLPPKDLVLGLALVHWLYSCTSDFGSLFKIVEWFAAHSTKSCILEWIAPEDPAIKQLGHIYKGKECHQEAYTEENFTSALYHFFGQVQVLKYGSATRRLYIARHKLEEPWMKCKSFTASVWQMPPFHVRKVYDLTMYPEAGMFEREVYWLRRLWGKPHVPKLAHVNEEKKEIVMEWVGTSLKDPTTVLPEDWQGQLLDLVALLAKHGLHYNDWDFSNLCVKDGVLYLIDFQWCPSLGLDFSCGGASAKLDKKPYGDFHLASLLPQLNTRSSKTSPT